LTLTAAIDAGVPAPIISAALFARFESRVIADYARPSAIGDAKTIRRT